MRAQKLAGIVELPHAVAAANGGHRTMGVLVEPRGESRDEGRHVGRAVA